MDRNAFSKAMPAIATIAALASFNLGSVPLAFPEAAAQATVSQTALPDILKATGAYCETVKQMALFFICTERIREEENSFSRGTGASRSSPDALKVSKTKTRTFVYDYQIVKKNDDVSEKRTLLEENGRRRYEENAELSTLKFSARNLVYGPVGFLSRYWQSHFVYEIVGEEEVAGKRAVIVRAVPNAQREENNNLGRVWVDAATYRILRIELEPQDLQGSEVNLDDKAAEGNAIFLGRQDSPAAVQYHRQLTWTIDFGEEKNGVQFPSRQVIREWYVSNMGFRIIKREVAFDYSGYKYFTVEVEVKSSSNP